MNRKQALAARRAAHNATKRDDNVGWFYINASSIDIYASRPGHPANTCRLSRRQLEKALDVMRALKRPAAGKSATKGNPEST